VKAPIQRIRLLVKETEVSRMRCARCSTKVSSFLFYVCTLVFFLALSKSLHEAKKTLVANTEGKESYQKPRKNAEPHDSFPECILSERANSCDIKINVLVTGVAGFVGSHVAEKIDQISKKILVVGADDLSAFGELQRINIPASVKFVECDLSEEDNVLDLFRNHGPIDIIYHIAAYGGQGMSNFIRKTMYTKNTVVSANLVNAAVNFGTKHFVFISSCAVYGSHAVVPLLEHKPVSPDDPYGISKYGTELDIQAANRQFNLNYTIFRAHNLYGPRQFLNDPFRNVVSIWLRQILLGQKITVFGSGDQTRSFTYIDDISSIIARAPFTLRAKNQIVNAGNEQSTKLNDMLNKMSELLGLNPDISHLPVRRETSEVNPDHSLQRSIFGKREFTSFRVGLKHTIEWAKSIPWESYGLAPHPYPEVKENMPASWLKLFDSGLISAVIQKATVNNEIRLNDQRAQKRIGSHITRNFCRFDGSPLVNVIDFGYVPLANNFLSQNSSRLDFESELLYPLTVGFDPTCGSLQVNVMPVAQENVWKDYYYFSSVIKSLSLEFEEYANEFSQLFEEPEQTQILEIGCNDGVFLRPLANLGFQLFGVDPASNVVSSLKDKYIIYNTFFGLDLAKIILAEHGKMHAIVTSNSFAHIDDMIDVMKGIKILLEHDGVLAIQVHYAVSMVEKMQYDWIYHEHLSYYTLYSLSKFLSKFDFKVFDAKETSMHGGSIRVYAQRSTMDRQETANVKKLREKEFRLGVDKLSFFSKFQEKMDETRLQLRKVILDLTKKNKSIVGYGAPARATTLSSYIGLQFIKKHLRAVIDDSPAKQGAFMPGTHLNIVSSKILYGESPPDCVFLFAWPWVNDIVKKNMNYLQNGGSFIVPLPEVLVIDVDNVSDFY
jgi:nucleoside-diphosphate-sugar epimerase/SAM-dependent methyltransferase